VPTVCDANSATPPEPAGEVRLPRWEQFLLVLAAAVGFALSGWQVWAYPLNKDESHTWWVVQAGPLDRVYRRACQYPYAPPLPFLVQRICSTVGGDSEFALRIPSLLAFAGTLVGIALLGRRLLGSSAGLLAVALLAWYPLAVEAARQARPYIFEMLLSVWATYALCHALTHARRWWTWIVYGVLMAALVQTTILFVLLAGFHFLWAVGYAWRHRREIPNPLPRAGLVVLLMGLSWLSLAGIWVHRWANRELYDWSSFPVRFTRLGEYLELPATAIAAAAAVLLALVWHRGRRDTVGWTRAWFGRWIWIWLWAAVPVTAMFVIATVTDSRTLFERRYTTMFAPAVVLAAAGLVGTIDFRPARWLGLIVLVVGMGIPGRVAVTLDGPPKQRGSWQQACAYLNDHARAGQTVFVYGGFIETPLILDKLDDPLRHEYLSARLSRLYLKLPMRQVALFCFIKADVNDIRRKRAQLLEMLHEHYDPFVEQALAEHETVWLVSVVGADSDRTFTELYVDWLSSQRFKLRGAAPEGLPRFGDLRVVRFQRE